MFRYLLLARYFLLFAVVVTAQAGDQGGEREGEAAIERVVLITLDTFRSDHLSAYGYPRETAPFITSLAKEGVLFKRFMAAASLTSPAHATLFTGFYPLQHNLLRNGEKLEQRFLTLAEVMKSVGFQTAGFVGTDIHFKIGDLDQGFDVFDEMERPDPKPPAKKGKREQVVMMAKGFKYRPAAKTVDRAVAWLETKTENDKFLLWIHLFDAHLPHQPPGDFLVGVQSEPSEKRAELAKFLFESQHIDFPGFAKYRDDGAIPKFIDRYDAEIRYMDSELERLYRFLQARGLDADTLWVIAADHGEGLGNHGYLGHDRNLYNEQLSIPLIFHFPEGKMAGTVVDQVVEQVDILPTLALLAGADPALSALVEGQSLLPLMEHGLSDTLEGAFAYKREFPLPPLSQMKQGTSAARKIREKIEETNLLQKPQGLLRSRQPETQEEWDSQASEKAAFQTQQYKYIFNALSEDEFYDLSNDPYETENLAGKGLGEEFRLRRRLMSKMKRLKKMARTNKMQKPLDKKTVEKLRSLGYIQ